MENWYYVGNFGQLGPLQRSDIEELISCGAIGRDTYVWREGMGDWRPAHTVSEWADHFTAPPSDMSAQALPPPTPNEGMGMPPARFAQGAPVVRRRPYWRRSRVLAGVLQFIVPGVGRMYLGHIGIGLAQLLLWPVCFLGHLWSIVDGILILVSGDATDAHGRPLGE